ncbi:uncharacterized protein [Typha latifolia]|uniref:uncharacterized protein n=1 Tax=Typha latifolia TaxID=4733 RepID=UPI003C2CA811
MASRRTRRGRWIPPPSSIGMRRGETREGLVIGIGDMDTVEIGEKGKAFGQQELPIVGDSYSSKALAARVEAFDEGHESDHIPPLQGAVLIHLDRLETIEFNIAQNQSRVGPFVSIAHSQDKLSISVTTQRFQLLSYFRLRYARDITRQRYPTLPNPNLLILQHPTLHLHPHFINPANPYTSFLSLHQQFPAIQGGGRRKRQRHGGEILGLYVKYNNAIVGRV